MKKRIVLGDTHGNFHAIETIYNNEQPDSVILLGDYCDSFTFNTSDVVNCWDNIQKLKSNHHGEFYTLMGNHDWHYIHPSEQYSGYRRSTWNAMHDKLVTAWSSKDIHVAYVDSINKTIYSHAGITNTWLNDWNNPSIDMLDDVNVQALCFSRYEIYDIHGDSIHQGPLWVRPAALLDDMYNDGIVVWKQIVGHTRVKNRYPILANSNKELCNDNIDDAILFVIDTMPFYYIRETLTDDGVIMKREIVKGEEIDKKFEQ